jgi:hypothetical protein
MSNGQASDAAAAAGAFLSLKQEIFPQLGSKLELHVIALGSGTKNQQLQQSVRALGKGKSTQVLTSQSLPMSWYISQMREMLMGS